MAYPLEKHGQTLAMKEKSESDLGKRKELIFKYPPITKDSVFNKMHQSINSDWEHLTYDQQKEILALVEELIENLKQYHDSYINLKSASVRRLYFDDTEKYKAAIKNADQREKILHDSFIDSLNILSRKMRSLKLDNSWRGDDQIWGITPQAKRQNPKLWMFRIFREEDLLARNRKNQN